MVNQARLGMSEGSQTPDKSNEDFVASILILPKKANFIQTAPNSVVSQNRSSVWFMESFHVRVGHFWGLRDPAFFILCPCPVHTHLTYLDVRGWTDMGRGRRQCRKEPPYLPLTPAASFARKQSHGPPCVHRKQKGVSLADSTRLR